MKTTTHYEKGHVLATFALAIASIAVIFSLTFQPVRGRALYTSPENLQNAADAAAQAASAEFKRNYLHETMQTAAQSQLEFYDIQPQSWDVETCNNVATTHELNLIEDLPELISIDPEVCTDPLKKIVRVSVTALVEPDGVPMTVESIAERPSVDVMLVIDTSDSMNYGWPGSPMFGDERDPKACNASDPAGIDGYPGSCSPFQDVKKGAALFVENIYFPYDRVGVVTFDKNAIVRQPLSDDEAQIENTILNLKVYEGEGKCTYYGSDLYSIDPHTSFPPTASSEDPLCRLYNDPGENVYQYLDCPAFYGSTPDATNCTTTNTGDSVALAGSVLMDARPSALPVLVLLSDGAANTGYDGNNGRLCPSAYNSWDWFDAGWPLCRDNDVLIRHCWDANSLTCINAPGTANIVDPAHYDPDDYARDMFDLVASNNILTFTIGMGQSPAQQGQDDINDIPPAETLLKYGAFGTYTHVTNPNARQGEYYFANDPSSLEDAFLEIHNQLIASAESEPEATMTAIPTATSIETLIPTITTTPTLTFTPTLTPTITLTPTVTETRTITSTSTMTATRTITRTPQPLHVEIINPVTDGQVITSFTETGFEAVAWDPDISTTNGAGITNVQFTFSGPSTIPSRNEPLAAYCAFGGNTPCPTMSSATFVALTPGTYTMFVTATAADGRTASTSKTFVIPVPATPTITATAPTRTPTRTSTITVTPTITFTTTITITRTSTRTSTPIIPTITPTITITQTNTVTPTESQIPLSTDTSTPTEAATSTPTETETPTPTSTSTPTETATSTPTETETPTPTSTSTLTETATSTPTETETPTPTSTFTPTETATPTPTETETPTATSTFTPTETVTPTQTASPTMTATPASLILTSIATQDGWVLESSEISGVGGSLNSTATVFRLGDDGLNRQYRAIVSFNTALLPDNAIIQSVLLKIKRDGSPVGSNPFNIFTNLWADLRKGSFDGDLALERADFNAAASEIKVGAFNKNPDAGWYTNVLNARGRNNINKTGLTQLRLYFIKDDNNNLDADYMKFFSGNSPSSQPQLIITYILPPAPTVSPTTTPYPTATSTETIHSTMTVTPTETLTVTPLPSSTLTETSTITPLPSSTLTVTPTITLTVPPTITKTLPPTSTPRIFD